MFGDGAKIGNEDTSGQIEARKPNPAFHSSYKFYFTRRSLATRPTSVS